ncbi:MAG: AmmeMemoRadiSam system protein B [Acidobacteria bacterium]|nr:AmmeMemoRadiSam system protein B [Acidobacteriota bacterium]
MVSRGPVRRAAVAGTWYPGTPDRIAEEVRGYLAGVERRALPGRLVGLISPHAGLRYSGPVAAHGYSLLEGRSALTAVLVGPSHHHAFDGVSVYARGAFETPLGVLPVDEELAAGLLDAAAGIADVATPHRDEHSLEMQLPFLQYLVPGLQVVPVLMGSQSRGEVDGLARSLARALEGKDRALLVASSDLSHYHPAPEANRLDGLVVGDVERFDADSLMDRLEGSHEHACGGGPMVAVMRAARTLGADRAVVLRYADSGDAGEHDKSRVVGYLSAALTAAKP